MLSKLVSRQVCRALLAVLGLATAGAGLARAQGAMVHTLDAFHAPTAVVATDEGRTLFVANSGRGEYGLVVGRGAVSRVSLGADGRLAVEKLRFIEGLNGPMALAIMTMGSDAIPAGTLAITVGGSWMVNAKGDPLDDDAARGTGLLFFDPKTGEARGRILVGENSPVAKILGHRIADPRGLAADPAGNLYLIDIDAAATRSSRRGESTAGVIKIGRAALDALVRGEEPPPGLVMFAREVNVPTAVVYSKNEDALIWSTFLGELRRLPQGDFSGRTSVITVSKEFPTAASLVVTPDGDIIGVAEDGRLVRSRGKRAQPIRFRKEPRFLSAGQSVIVAGANGQTLLIVPEQGGGSVGAWRQRLNVMALSK